MSDAKVNAAVLSAVGTGYNVATHSTSGRHGAGCTIAITAVDSGDGHVDTWNIAAGGTGYYVGDILTIGGTGAGATITVTAVDNGDLVTLAAVKLYLWPGETITQWDSILPTIITAVSKAIVNEIGCDIIHTHYTSEKVDGRGRSYLDLKNWPVTKVTSIIDQDGNVYTEGNDEDFVIKDFSLRLMSGVWAKGEQNFTVSYEAGFTTLPGDILLVCYEMIARKWKTMKEQGWGESSRSFPDGSTSSVNADGEFNKSQLAILAKYKRPRL